ncbi:MAG: hypothetical protein HUJ16_00750 [Kangiella sp.]|nr:hypothetical protein [Kangiella sp.]
MRKVRRKRTEEKPFIAWWAVGEMLSSMTDDQLMTLDGLVAGELSRRRNGEDPRQRQLWGGQAVENNMEVIR